MAQVLLAIAPFFIVILTGFLFTRIKLVKADWTQVLNLFALRVGFPSLIFTALVKSKFSFAQHGNLIIVNSEYLLFCFGLAIIVSRIFKLSEKLKYTLFIIFPFGNIAYLGMPISSEIYGIKVLPQVSLIVGIYLFWLFTLGIYVLEIYKNRNAGFRNVIYNLFKNPLLIAVMLGLALSFFNLNSNNVILKAVDIISKAATPVVLFSIGIFISTIKPGNLRDWGGVGLYSVIKLIVLPLLFWLSINKLPFDSLNKELSVIEAAMPLALTPYALSQEYMLDSEFVTRSILLTTLLSILSIPFWVLFSVYFR